MSLAFQDLRQRGPWRRVHGQVRDNREQYRQEQRLQDSRNLRLNNSPTIGLSTYSSQNNLHNITSTIWGDGIAQS